MTRFPVAGTAFGAYAHAYRDDSGSAFYFANSGTGLEVAVIDALLTVTVTTAGRVTYTNHEVLNPAKTEIDEALNRSDRSAVAIAEALTDLFDIRGNAAAARAVPMLCVANAYASRFVENASFASDAMGEVIFVVPHRVLVTAGPGVRPVLFEFAPDDWRGRRRSDQYLDETVAMPPAPRADPSLTVTRDAYESVVADALDRIRAGEVYQVQVGHAVTSPLLDDRLAVFRRLREKCPSAYSFGGRVGAHLIFAASPEVFVRVGRERIDMRPLAGTTPRLSDLGALGAALRADPKEVAEHVMLVDVCRNDLGAIGSVGSVSVESLLEVETLPNVLHLASSVSCARREDWSQWRCLFNVLPAATTTGAPKIRASQLLYELETTRRGFYSGIVAWAPGDGSLDSTLLIRSVFIDSATAYVRASAGVVADSEPAREWSETLSKAAGPLAAVTSVALR